MSFCQKHNILSFCLYIILSKNNYVILSKNITFAGIMAVFDY